MGYTLPCASDVLSLCAGSSICWCWIPYSNGRPMHSASRSCCNPRGTGPNFDGGVPLVNAKTHLCLRETKGPDKPHVSGNYPRGDQSVWTLHPISYRLPCPASRYSNLQVVIALLCKCIRCQLPQLSISGYQNRWKYAIWTPVVGTMIKYNTQF